MKCERAPPADRRGVDGGDAADAVQRERLHDAEADRAQAQHDGDVAGLGPGEPDGVQRDCQRLDEGARRVADGVGECKDGLAQGRARHEQPLGEATARAVDGAHSEMSSKSGARN